MLTLKLAAFARAYPDVTLHVSVDDGFTDIVRDGINAGIRLGESVAQGMTEVRVSANRGAARGRLAVILGSRPMPEAPHDPSRHLCIARRYAPGRGVHR